MAKIVQTSGSGEWFARQRRAGEAGITAITSYSDGPAHHRTGPRAQLLPIPHRNDTAHSSFSAPRCTCGPHAPTPIEQVIEQ